MILRHASDADDSVWPLVDGQDPVQGLVGTSEQGGYGFVDDDDARGVGPVRRIEVPSGDQREAEHVEVTVSDGRGAGAQDHPRFPKRTGGSGDGDVVAVPEQGKSLGHGGGLHAGHPLEPFDHGSLKLTRTLGRVVHETRAQPDQDDSVWIHPRALVQVRHAAHEQPRGNQQDDRHGYLRDHQAIAGRRSRAPARRRLLLQYRQHVDPHRLKGRCEPADHRSEGAQNGRCGQRPAADGHVERIEAARVVGAIQPGHHLVGPLRHQQADGTPSSRKQQAFRKKLTNHLPARRAERETNRDLFPA